VDKHRWEVVELFFCHQLVIDSSQPPTSNLLSHSQEVLPNCHYVLNLITLNSIIVQYGYSHIFINEAQFFPDLLPWITYWSKLGITITLAALNACAQQTMWPCIQSIEPFTDTTVKLTAICQLCGYTYAPFTIRKDTINNIDIGGDEKYLPLCRQCFYENK